MSQLMDALKADPEAVFDIEADLPSGNKMLATVGPMINGKVCASICFAHHPVSDTDVEWARRIMNEAMGSPPAGTSIITTPEEAEQAQVAIRKFFGGGQG